MALPSVTHAFRDAGQDHMAPAGALRSLCRRGAQDNCIIRSVVSNHLVTERAPALIYIRRAVRFHMTMMHATANTKRSTSTPFGPCANAVQMHAAILPQLEACASVPAE